MIVSKSIKNFKVYIKDNNEIYENIFRDFLNNDLDVIKVFRSIEDTKVSLINTPHGKFVFKVFAPKEKKVERFFKSFVKGDYYLNLLLQTDRVRNEGITFPNDFYLLAEKKIFNYASVFIMIIEFVDGIELSDVEDFNENIRTEIHNKMNELHQHNMVSGDPHKGNFILSQDGIRIIDLSGKACNAKRKAKDRIDMERHLNIDNAVNDFAYYSVVYRNILRQKIKSFKAKIKMFLGFKKRKA
ncbi:lipopolysaccharide core heptose(II) kinase RfaY [Hafnia alvei]|uniref:lipopolysaccharide core heptose(II) kinase RfaY n=1 Tax=Hafnia alvei TaxID=569 RepID=UPI000E02A8C9|nr:lipopolysaccharide core heptose(II) kinase RfaY [Hafnia alvei]STQ73040.1 Lipopolysaccharide core heptose(II) kinase rfaY [Hafnia alvei]